MISRAHVINHCTTLAQLDTALSTRDTCTVCGHPNRILTWLPANTTGFCPQNTPTGGFEGGDKPGAQLVGFEQAATTNTLKIGKYTY